MGYLLFTNKWLIMKDENCRTSHNLQGSEGLSSLTVTSTAHCHVFLQKPIFPITSELHVLENKQHFDSNSPVDSTIQRPLQDKTAVYLFQYWSNDHWQRHCSKQCLIPHCHASWFCQRSLLYKKDSVTLVSSLGPIKADSYKLLSQKMCQIP